MRTRLGSMSPAGGSAIPPTVEFPSQRKERVDWHKLASVDLHDLASGCTIDFLQENLSHVTFCDAEAEFDISTISGQRSLLKMYRLAQLIIQYLFLSQEYIENQLQQSQEEVQQVTEKYQQMKSKLVQQVEEAKKMKATNKSMRETVKYVNSVALANGLFQPSKCPLCCKTFRGQEYLNSHVWRKHPNQASSVILPQPSTSTHVGAVSGAAVDNRLLEVPSSVPESSLPVTELVKRSSIVPEPVKTLLPAPEPVKTNDVDTYRLLEIEKKCDKMNENFNKILKDMENQKYVLERENERCQDEVKKAWEEKNDLENGYEAHLAKLGEHISQLQNAGGEPVTFPDSERLLEHIRKQDLEIKALKHNIDKQVKANNIEGKENKDFVDGISTELQELKMQLHQQKKNHKRSLAQIQESFRKEYEEALETEKLKLREVMHDFTDRDPAEKTPRPEYHTKTQDLDTTRLIGHREHVDMNGHLGSNGRTFKSKPPPSPKVPPMKKPSVPDKSTKPHIMSPDMYEDSVHTFLYSHESGSDSMYGKTRHLPSDSETDSETETSRWDQNDLKLHHLRSTDNEDETQDNIHASESDETENSSTESEDNNSNVNGDTSEGSLSLETLLKENPELWTQMRKATSEVLTSKLSLLGIEPSDKGIKSDTLNSCLSKLRKQRRKLEDKYEDFGELRKKLGNEVIVKLDNKIENAESSLGTHQPQESKKSNKKRDSGVLSKVVSNVRSKVKESSKVLTSSVSKTSESVKSGAKGIFSKDSKTSGVKVISRPSSSHSKPNSRPTSAHSKPSSRPTSAYSKPARQTVVQDDTSSSDEETEDSRTSSAHVEIHNETFNSVSRNLFGDDPLPGGSGIKPKQGNFFENKTYGQVDDDEDMSGWDSGSDPEYENVKKAEPPKRSDSLPGTSEAMNYPSAFVTSWDLPEAKPIKLKKPTGEKVSTLSRTIEFQLGGRSKSKMAGAVDVMSGLPGTSQAYGGDLEPPGSLQSTLTESRQNIHSVSDSSNTIPTSLWGSGEAVNKIHKSGVRPSTSKGVIHSWDSEENLEISDLE